MSFSLYPVRAVPFLSPLINFAMEHVLTQLRPSVRPFIHPFVHQTLLSDMFRACGRWVARRSVSGLVGS